jgi:hypothetical protein
MRRSQFRQPAANVPPTTLRSQRRSVVIISKSECDVRIAEQFSLPINRHVSRRIDNGISTDQANEEKMGLVVS